MAASKAGRTKYQPYYPELAYWMAHAGLTDEQIAEKFGVDRRTITRWKTSHPEFGEALERGKETPDDQVEAALLKRALGYSYTEERLAKDGCAVEVQLAQAPDVTACIFWLKNRRPEKWRDVQKIEATSTVTIRQDTEDAIVKALATDNGFAREVVPVLAGLAARRGGNGNGGKATSQN